MNYSVGKLAKLSGVSIRTLRFYDQIGLLKPSYVSESRYRYYQKAELLKLQQILFFRELGFELKQIQAIFAQSDFDRVQALHSHKKVLKKNIQRMQALMKTIDKTVNHLERKQAMADQEMYLGFSKEKQAEYEQYLIEKGGEQTKKHIAESKGAVQDWTSEDWNRHKAEYDELSREFVEAMAQKCKADSPVVQLLVARHYTWIKKLWTPNRESYTGLGQLYLEHPDFRKLYDSYDPDLAQFLADAMKSFADREL